MLPLHHSHGLLSFYCPHDFEISTSTYFTCYRRNNNNNNNNAFKVAHEISLSEDNETKICNYPNNDSASWFC